MIRIVSKGDLLKNLIKMTWPSNQTKYAQKVKLSMVSKFAENTDQ